MNARVHDIIVTVNGEETRATVDARKTLVDFLREDAGIDRQPCRLRARRLRRLQRARRRRGGARLPDARRAMRWRARRDDRGRGRYGRDRRPAGGVHRAQRAAVRLLHAGHAADGAGAAGRRRRPEPRTNPRASLRQLLPLHRLSGDRGCGGSRREGARTLRRERDENHRRLAARSLRPRPAELLYRPLGAAAQSRAADAWPRPVS